jgi:transposase, IS5 family
MGFEGLEGVRTLTLSPPQVEALRDERLPLGAGELPQDLARIDERLRDPERCGRSQSTGSGRGERRGPSAAAHGRPTIAMETYVRLLVIKQRTGWGYETLVREVSDSLRLRRFLSHRLHERVPDESTRRKLTRRLGAETVAALTAPDHEAHMERRPRARAVRIDSTVVEADVRYPTDAGLAAHGVRALAREGKKLAARVSRVTSVRDRSRAMGGTLRGSDAPSAAARGRPRLSCSS